MNGSSSPKSRLGLVLGAVFALAVLMGTGPGLYLVNPDPSDPETKLTVLGMPIIYVWAVCWFFVEAGVILVAYFWLWNSEPADTAEESMPKEGGQ